VEAEVDGAGIEVAPEGMAAMPRSARRAVNSGRSSGGGTAGMFGAITSTGSRRVVVQRCATKSCGGLFQRYPPEGRGARLQRLDDHRDRPGAGAADELPRQGGGPVAGRRGQAHGAQRDGRDIAAGRAPDLPGRIEDRAYPPSARVTAVACGSCSPGDATNQPPATGFQPKMSMRAQTPARA
jgi:hypothetical protein